MITYERYKASDIEWLGEIPEHWQLKRFRYCFVNSKGLSITKENLIDEGIPCVNYGEIHSKYGFEVNPEIHPLLCVAQKYLETNSSSLLNQGDFVFADTSEDIEGSGNFTHLASNEQAFAGYHTVISRLKTEANPRFIAYSFDSIAYRTQIRTRVQGVKVFSITNKILKDTILWFPSSKEQTAIVNYLDEKTNKIDQLVANKKEQIEKLKEIRQIEINTAVTKGLNPNAELKPSGIDWLGDIPEHWEIKRLKNHLILNPEKGKSGFDKDSKMLATFLPMEMVFEDGTFDSSIQLPLNELWNGYTYFKKGDVLLAKITPCFENGKGTILKNLPTVVGFGTTEFHVLRSRDFKLLNEYIFCVIRSEMFMKIGEAMMTGAAGQKRIPSSFIKSFVIGIPPINEQIKIINHLDEKTQKIDQLVANIKKQIKKLEEIRKIEIYNAVTGKIKVV
jgi:type I restriction enzyme S subunit